MSTLEQRLLDHARQLGFALAGIAPAVEADGFEHLCWWLEQGYAGEMHYLHDQREARRHPRGIYPPVRSVVMVGMSYAPSPPHAPIPSPPRPLSHGGSGGDREDHGALTREELGALTRPRSPACTPARGAGEVRGRVARYAQGPDYHHVLRERLKQLGGWLREQRPECWGRAVVDTAPLLERDFARRAGLGWIGKNTMLLDTRHGSWVLLGGLLTDLELQPSSPSSVGHCGTCTACLDACPTQAFAAPHVLDARKCISYLTIELKSDVPEHLRPELRGWLFGCDVCQEVCPWNHKALRGHPALGGREDLVAVDLIELLGMTPDAFRQRFEGTALHPRPGRPAVLRNAAILLGNAGDERALPALERAREDEEPLVRNAAAWAATQIRKRRGMP